MLLVGHSMPSTGKQCRVSSIKLPKRVARDISARYRCTAVIMSAPTKNSSRILISCSRRICIILKEVLAARYRDCPKYLFSFRGGTITTTDIYMGKGFFSRQTLLTLVPMILPGGISVHLVTENSF